MLNGLPEGFIGDATLTSPPKAPSDSRIRAATAADAKPCLDALTQAFENDPPCRWIWPGLQQYREAFPRFAQAFGGGAFRLGAAHYYEGFSGAALWLPPGAAPDEKAVVRVMGETVPDERLDAVFAIFEQMDAYHPKQPHWHLPLIGVVPENQGQGIGSALLRYALETCDRERVPAYLEATSRQNAVLYERVRFRALGRIEVDDCPPIIPMLRRPR
jgi:GNAT superfamily N-acetyltransferase